MLNDHKSPSQSHPQDLAKEGQTTHQESNTNICAARFIIPALTYLKDLTEMIKLEHTVFALPFALLGAITTTRGLPPRDKVMWILTAVVAARTAAMTFNRLVDQDIDTNNPRTKNRALPTGRVSQGSAVWLLGASIVAFGYAAGRLGSLPWNLAPLALLIILSYSVCKRFTLLSHIVLGLSLAVAPLGACIAVNGTIDPPIWFLAVGVLAWTTGFDIIYALQDVAFDQEYKLHSIPSRVGVTSALWVSRTMHIAAVSSWAAFNCTVRAQFLSWTAWFVVTIILIREQWVVRKGDLERIDHAFFTLNSMVGVFFFLGHAIELAFIRLKL